MVRPPFDGCVVHVPTVATIKRSSLIVAPLAILDGGTSGCTWLYDVVHVLPSPNNMPPHHAQ